MTTLDSGSCFQDSSSLHTQETYSQPPSTLETSESSCVTFSNTSSDRVLCRKDVPGSPTLDNISFLSAQQYLDMDNINSELDQSGLDYSNSSKVENDSPPMHTNRFYASDANAFRDSSTSTDQATAINSSNSVTQPSPVTHLTQLKLPTATSWFESIEFCRTVLELHTATLHTRIVRANTSRINPDDLDRKVFNRRRSNIQKTRSCIKRMLAITQQQIAYLQLVDQWFHNLETKKNNTPDVLTSEQMRGLAQASYDAFSHTIISVDELLRELGENVVSANSSNAEVPNHN